MARKKERVTTTKLKRISEEGRSSSLTTQKEEVRELSPITDSVGEIVEDRIEEVKIDETILSIP